MPKEALDWRKTTSGEIVSKNNIDSYIPKLSTDEARNELTYLQNIQTEINNTKGSWDGYNEQFQGGRKYLIDYARTNNVLEASVDDVKGATDNARQAAISHNVALQQQTLGAKAATLGLKALSVAGNMLLSMGISMAISAALKGLDCLIHRSEKIIEKGEEAREVVQGIKDDFDNLEKSTNSSKQRYAEFAQEVENLGKVNQSKGTLSNNEYSEFLDISNELAELFPSLTKGFDENGNAILNLSGDVNTITSALNDLIEAERQAANIKILENMDAVWAGYYEKVYGKRKTSYSNSKEASIKKRDDTLKAIDTLSSSSSEFKIQVRDENGQKLDYEGVYEQIGEALERSGIYIEDILTGVVEDGNSQYLTFDMSTIYDADDILKEVKSRLGTGASSYEKDLIVIDNNIQSEKSKIMKYINSWLSTDVDLSSDMQNVAKEVLFSGKWLDNLPEDVNKESWNEVSDWLQNNFIAELSRIRNNKKIKDELTDIFYGDFNIDEARNLVGQLETENGFAEDNPLIVYLEAQIANQEEFERELATTIEKIAGMSDYGDTDWNKYFKDQSIDTQEELDKWNEVTKGCNTATEAMEAWEKATADAADKATSSLSELSKSLDNIQSAYKSVQSAIQEYNEQGYLSVDTYQALMELEPQYLNMLIDENGNLDLSTAALKENTAAYIENMGVKSALNLIDSVSKYQGEAEQLKYLTGVTNEATTATWAFVDSKLEEIALVSSPAVVDALTQRIEAIKTMTQSAIDGIGKGGLDKSTTDKSKKASEKISNDIDKVKLSIDALSDSISKLDDKASLINDNDFLGKVNITQQSIALTQQKVSALVNEFARLKNIVPSTSNAASTLANRMKEVGEEI